jgi:predicted DsbA family dithiol-disulfide isomerase
MRVDIWSDVVCPWCYVGKARFEKALGFEHRNAIEVVFRSFELDPAAKTGGQETNPGAPPKQMISAKFGLPIAQARQMEERVAGLAQVLDAIYQANFAEARQVFDSGVITDVATQAGLDAAEVAKVLDGDAVRSDEELARQLRITGVPFFVLDMKIGVSGAQSAETLTQAHTQASESAEA